MPSACLLSSRIPKPLAAHQGDFGGAIPGPARGAVRSGEDLQKLPLRERKAALTQIIEKLGNNLVIRYVEHFDASGESVLENARKMSLEGIVSKQLDYIYRPPTNAAAIVADIGSMS
jgi:hypothetical protein